MLQFLKKKIVIIPAILFIVFLAVYFVFFRGEKISYDFTEVNRGEVIQIVSATGQVKPAEDVDLAFEIGGKLSQINVKVGDKVILGQMLAILQNNDTRAQLSQASANIESAKASLLQYKAALAAQEAKLAELKIGTRAEEIQIAQTTVDNAKISLADYENTLNIVKTKADADLRSDYDTALTACAESLNKALDAIFTLSDIQYAHFMGSQQSEDQLANAKTDAVYALTGLSNGGRMTKDAINQYTGGARNSVAIAQTNSSYSNIDKALSDISNALQKTKTALNAVPLTFVLTTTEKTDLATAKTTISSEITTTASNQQAINTQKETNSNSIATAELNVNTAKNTLASAGANLALKKAGSPAEQISAQEAAVRQAEANVAAQEASVKQYQASYARTQSDYEKTILKAPSDGIITAIDKKRGETIQAATNVISMINQGQFQIEANVSETDISKIKLGNNIALTLDSLGPNEKFSGKVIKIDPAETVVSGVIYYKVTSVFDMEDARIKSGMTVNMDIETDKRENVLVLPYYLIKEKNDRKYILAKEENDVIEKEIKTGLEGEIMVEILDGLNEGDMAAAEKK
jgi:HlyD family secretion protein